MLIFELYRCPHTEGYSHIHTCTHAYSTHTNTHT